ncbi:MAG TPA: proton-conducting transporter membrane subunit, partial [Thermoanaerobaculia bacterium]
FMRGRLPAVVQVAGAMTGLTGSALGFFETAKPLVMRWGIPFGAIAIRVDALSAFFAAPVFLLAGAGAIYAEGYWPRAKRGGAYVRCFFGVLAGALALVMVADNTIFFVAAWELVALSSFFLVAVDMDDAARGAAWLYLAASHVALLSLLAVVTLLHSATGTWRFAMLPAHFAMTPAGTALFWLILIAGGIKAGAMPFHVWLPGAHAAAPSHVSAMMSGVVLKMGIYGIVRVLSLYADTPPWMGGTVLAFGIVSSILGVAFALAQHDLKRLLAYHSIENIGIILIGIGGGFVARSYGATTVAFLALAGGLLHVWNHASFKSLLFLAAGSAIHGTHTREIDRMGGLARRMPFVSAGFLLGAVAICGLPPLNGFISEWLIYLSSFSGIGQFHDGWTWLLVVLIAPALALTGALALACFIKAFGVVFLGAPRTAEAEQAKNAPATMRAALVPPGLACIVIGLFPALLAPLLERVVRIAGVTGSAISALSALQPMTIALAIAATIAVGALFGRTQGAPHGPTWDCGYAAPSPRMQYTASSFARGLVMLFRWAMPPVIEAPGRLPLFPGHAHFESHVPDTVLDRALVPLLRRAERLFAFARFMQSGRVQLYLIYVGTALIALLVWSFR